MSCSVRTCAARCVDVYGVRFAESVAMAACRAWLVRCAWKHMANAMQFDFESILDAVRDCDPANLPGLIGALEQAKAEAWGRLSTPVTSPPQEAKAQPERLLTPEEAASIAQVPVRRLYGWARGQGWARRPTRRCLRIGEASIRRLVDRLDRCAWGKAPGVLRLRTAGGSRPDSPGQVACRRPGPPR